MARTPDGRVHGPSERSLAGRALSGDRSSMDAGVPPELAVLLNGRDPETREDAWSALLERYNGLLLKAAGTFGDDYDRRMDRYGFIVEGLRKDDFRRLRSFQARPESGFASWLLVVARRLCLDHQRATYGRGGRSAHPERADRDLAARRRLADLAGVALEPDSLAGSVTNPEQRLRERELHDALDSVLASLEPRDRLLLKLRFEDDRPVREIVDVMGFPSIFHVYRRLRHALAEARGRLEARGIGGPAP